jgi:hypothetical protein
VTPDSRTRFVRDPIVRAAGYCLLAASGGWLVLALVFVLPTLSPSLYGPIIVAVLLAPIVVLACCALGVLRGSRPFAVVAIVVLALLTATLLLVLPLNAVLVVLLAMAWRRLDRPRRRPARSRPPWRRRPWSRHPAVLTAAAGCLLASVAGAVWTVVTAAVDPTTLIGPNGRGNIAVVVGILLVPPAALAVSTVAFLRSSPGWASAAAVQLALYAAASLATAGAARWPGGWWVLINGVLLIPVVHAYVHLHHDPPPTAATPDGPGPVLR